MEPAHFRLLYELQKAPTGGLKMLTLKLARLSADYPGIYDGLMPKRALLAVPGLVTALEKARVLKLGIVLSDLLRSPARSLARRRELDAAKKPQLALPPGFSPHNFGRSFDCDVNVLIRVHGSKKAADEALAELNLFCHRRDHALGSECWHYNYLDPSKGERPHDWEKSTSGAVERAILSDHGAALSLREGNLDRLPEALAQAGFYGVAAFQQAWGLGVDGIAGPKTRRTLASVTAKITEV